MSKKFYKSQSHYENGGLMCTAASIFWVVGSLQDILSPFCSETEMDALMKHASHIQSFITKKNNVSLLQQHEVFSLTNVPPNIELKELGMYTHTSNEYTPPKDVAIHISDIHSICPNNTGLLITGGKHTTGIVNKHHTLYWFDSLVACVVRIQNREELSHHLLNSHGHHHDYGWNITLLTKK